MSSAGCGVLLLAACVLTGTHAAGQQPTFRAGVDLVAVDVQVVDSEGNPVTELGPSDFDVSIGGRTRRVASVELIRYAEVDSTPFRPTPPGPTPMNVLPPPPSASAGGRTYILAFDIGSLTVADSRALVGSALTFVSRLEPSDRIGLFLFPVGPRVDPTTDHALVRARLAQVTGSRSNARGFDSRFNLSPSEVIDITAQSVRATSRVESGRGGRGTSTIEDAMIVGDESDTIRAVQMRQCTFSEVQCGDEIRAEAMAMAAFMEGRAVQGLNGIRSLVTLLGTYPGRKTLVVFSAGMPTSDVPGGRPDLGTLPAVLGKDAASTNTAIYALHVNSGQLRLTSVATSRAVGSPATRSRDFAVEGRALEEFSGASGGALFRVSTGAGELPLARVLRETSALYLIGVEPDPSDRDGAVRELRVRVKRDNVTVRNRRWVAIQGS